MRRPDRRAPAFVSFAGPILTHSWELIMAACSFCCMFSALLLCVVGYAGAVVLPSASGGTSLPASFAAITVGEDTLALDDSVLVSGTLYTQKVRYSSSPEIEELKVILGTDVPGNVVILADRDVVYTSLYRVVNTCVLSGCDSVFIGAVGSKGNDTLTLKLTHGRGKQVRGSLRTTLLLEEDEVSLRVKGGLLPPNAIKPYARFESVTGKESLSVAAGEGSTVSLPASDDPVPLSERIEMVWYTQRSQGVLDSGWYTRDGGLLVTEKRRPVQRLKRGARVLVIGGKRRFVRIDEAGDYARVPLRAYHTALAKLYKIRQRYYDSPDRDQIVLSAAGAVSTEMVVRFIDAAFNAGFSKLNLAVIRDGTRGVPPSPNAGQAANKETGGAESVDDVLNRLMK